MSASTSTMPGTVQRWQIRAKPQAPMTVDDFVLVPVNLPEPAEGQVAIRVLALSLDPYLMIHMRSWKGDTPGWEEGIIRGRVVAQVLASKSCRFAPGDLLWGVGHWQEYDVLDADGLTAIPPDGLPATTALGVVGRSGLTAWVGMRLGEPKPGETLLVSSAVGPVGSVAGQIGRLRGMRVIGIAGGAEKCRQAVEHYGYEVCIDHHAPDLAEQLAAAAPQGIDLLFENVGAKSMDPALGLMAMRGRIMLCGLIQHYSDAAPVALANFRELLLRMITFRGFATTDFMEWFPQAEAELRDWVARGELRYMETITEGLFQAPAAYLAMIAGEGSGKHLLHLADAA